MYQYRCDEITLKTDIKLLSVTVSIGPLPLSVPPTLLRPRGSVAKITTHRLYILGKALLNAIFISDKIIAENISPISAAGIAR